ncbi:hypothetical protein RSO01_85690 [Reyranella soli]|uniref:Uncharacterized protein n=1 Tax=Reyranella soli TaxID=1230389 RepID=A0A512NR26_9HYPH|nr:hypothetical protein RSO01_85690 [Reyranella soli]
MWNAWPKTMLGCGHGRKRRSTETGHRIPARRDGGALAHVEPVKEMSEGRTVWEGRVHVFSLEGHPKATRAYAWSSPIEGRDKRRFYAVLHLGGIRSPLDAVRAAILEEQRRFDVAGPPRQ